MNLEPHRVRFLTPSGIQESESLILNGELIDLDEIGTLWNLFLKLVEERMRERSLKVKQLTLDVRFGEVKR